MLDLKEESEGWDGSEEEEKPSSQPDAVEGQELSKCSPETSLMPDCSSWNVAHRRLSVFRSLRHMRQVREEHGSSKPGIICLQQKCFRAKIKLQTNQMILCRCSLSPVLPVTWLRAKAQCIRPTVSFMVACFPGHSWQIAPVFLILCSFIFLASFCSPFS